MPKEKISPEEQAWRDSWQQALQEEKTNGSYDPVAEDWQYIYFVSHSRGRGRNIRRGRDVEMARNRETGKTFLLKDVPVGRLDTVAQALLGDIVDDDENVYEVFLRRLRSQARG